MHPFKGQYYYPKVLDNVAELWLMQARLLTDNIWSLNDMNPMCRAGLFMNRAYETCRDLAKLISSSRVDSF